MEIIQHLNVILIIGQLYIPYLQVYYIIILIYIHNYANYKKKLALYGLIIINILHTMEDLLENISTFGLENIIIKIKNKKTLDNDSYQNFIGDVLSGFFGSVIIYLIYINYYT